MGIPKPPAQIYTPFPNLDTKNHNIHDQPREQFEINPQIPKNQKFPISEQRITGIHQTQRTLNGAIIEPNYQNQNIPQAAIKIFTNEKMHNKTHKRSRRIIDKNQVIILSQLDHQQDHKIYL